jgi:regulator of RNase E activity RraA
MRAGQRDELSARLARLDTCAVSDALDQLGLPGAVTGIAPLVPAAARLAGPVITVRVAGESIVDVMHDARFDTER